MSNLRSRMKVDVELSEDKTFATVSFRFRGLDEAESFRKLVANMVENFMEFKYESDMMDVYCKDRNCTEF